MQAGDPLPQLIDLMSMGKKIQGKGESQDEQPLGLSGLPYTAGPHLCMPRSLGPDIEPQQELCSPGLAEWGQ